MGLRESINKSPKLGIGVTAVLLAVAVAALAYSFWPESNKLPTRAFYSDDDGKTVFVDAMDKIPPFDNNGKVAVGAAVFTADGGKTQFVGYLKRYPEDVKKRLEASAGKTGQNALTASSPEIAAGGFEVKKPGDPTWVNAHDMRRRGEVMRVKGPANSDVDSVMP